MPYSLHEPDTLASVEPPGLEGLLDALDDGLGVRLHAVRAVSGDVLGGEVQAGRERVEDVYLERHGGGQGQLGRGQGGGHDGRHVGQQLGAGGLLVPELYLYLCYLYYRDKLYCIQPV